MAIKFAAKDQPKAAAATAGKTKANVDPKADAAPALTPSAGEADLFDAAPKTPSRKRKKK